MEHIDTLSWMKDKSCDASKLIFGITDNKTVKPLLKQREALLENIDSMY